MDTKSIIKHELKKSKSCPQNHNRVVSSGKSGNHRNERPESAYPLQDSNGYFGGADVMLPSVKRRQKSKSPPSQLSSIGSTYTPTSPGPSFSLASTNSAKQNSRATKYGTPLTTNLLKSPYLQPIVIVTNPFIIGTKLRKRKSTTEEKSGEPQQTRNKTTVNPSFAKKKIEKMTSFSRKMPVSSLNCDITLRYVGGRLSASVSDLFRHDICVYQQHCGGNPVTVYQGSLMRGETFGFKSRRHANYSFSITLYVDGLLNQRVSACCEYKHRQGSKLGGSTGHFLLVSVKGSFPCYRCQMIKPTAIRKGVNNSHGNEIITSKVSELSLLESSEDCDDSSSSSSDSKEYDDDFEEDKNEAATRRETVEITEHQNDQIVERDTFTAIDSESTHVSNAQQEDERSLSSEPEAEDRSERGETTDKLADNATDGNCDKLQTEEDEIKDATPESHYDPPTKTDSDPCDERNSPSSTDQGGNSTEDDDADASNTSSEVSSDDDDIVYQADSNGCNTTRNDSEHCNGSGPTGQNQRQKQWTVYSEGGQQFDSSDEEGYVDNSSKPVTVQVDVHASEQIEYATGNSQIVTT